MKEITDNQANYLAGLTDGEGCFTIRKAQRCHTHLPVFYASVSITNTYRPLMDYLKEFTGVGFIYMKSRKTTKHKIGWRWELDQHEIVNFTTIVCPFLIVKKEQAKIMLEFFKCHRRFHRDSPMTPKEQGLLQVLCDEIQALNATGPGE